MKKKMVIFTIIVSVVVIFTTNLLLAQDELYDLPTLIDNGRIYQETEFNIPEIQAFLDQQPGILKTYQEPVGDEIQSAATIIMSVSDSYNISPKLLLTFLELKTELLSNPYLTSADVTYAMGFVDPNRSGLALQLDWAGMELRQGLQEYAMVGQTIRTPQGEELFVEQLQITFADGSSLLINNQSNQGSYTVARFLALNENQAEWEILINSSFITQYKYYWQIDPRQPLPEDDRSPFSPATTPFLINPYSGSFSHNSLFDHQYPDYTTNGSLTRYDGSVGNYTYDGHDANDYGLPVNTPVLATADGSVTLAGNVTSYCWVTGRNETAKVVTILHSNGHKTSYWHLNSISVSVGATLSAGNQIALSGNTGCVSPYPTPSNPNAGAHLHFYVRKDVSGVYRATDPYGWTGSYTEPCTQNSTCAGSSYLWLGTDTTAPSLAITNPAPNTWYTSNQTLSWIVSDTGSGPAYSKWGWNDSTPDNQVNGSSGSTALSAAGEGQHTLYVQAWDNAGNATGVESRGWFGYDVTAPTNPTSVNAGCTATSGVWQKTCNDPAFTWSGAGDGSGSGVKDYHIYWGTNSAGAPDTWRNTADYNPGAISTPGGVATYYLRVATRDNVGHEAAAKTLFILRYDNSNPAGSPLINNNAVTVNNINVLVQPQGSDTGSGIAKVRLSNNGTTWQALTPGTAVPWSLLGNNRDWNPVWVQLEDGVGNRSAIYELQTCLDLYPASPSSSSYRLWSGGLAAAGGQGSSTSFRLTDTVGQTASGSLLSSSSYRLQSGFGGGTAVPGSAAYQPFQCGQSGPVYLPMVIRP